MAAKRRYWLMKSEPNVYSIDDLKRDGSTCWEGVRNYQARNLMRDEMKLGDGVLFYHSNTRPMAVVGLARVSKEAYPDFAQFEEDNHYYDPKATKEKPIWFMVDIEFVEKFPEPLPLHDLKEVPQLEGMALLQRGQRLSVQRVTSQEWRTVCRLAGVKAR